MEVSIDQDLCTGCGICEMEEPRVFFMFSELAYVKQAPQEEGGEEPDSLKDGEPIHQGILGRVSVPQYLEEGVIQGRKLVQVNVYI